MGCLQLGGENAAADYRVVLLNEGVLKMSLCEICGEGKLEMCQYFKENFLEIGGPVKDCPKFWPDPEEVHVEVLETGRAGKTQILASRTVRKAMAGERVMLLSAYKAAQAERLMRAIADSNIQDQVASVRICLRNGGEIWIGGVDHVDQQDRRGEGAEGSLEKGL